ITPFAGRFPFECWLLPKRHSCSYRDTTEEERAGIAEVLLKTLRRLVGVLKDVPYNIVFHTSPARIPRHSQWHTLGEDFHWHIEIIPRLTRITGFELGGGMFILRTSPEDAAKYLKEVQDD
ncbi:MAG: galactose-1-phosphate uridylyltransferase, partial [Nitrospirae bacterium]